MHHVIEVLYRPEFCHVAVKCPTDEEREKAKQWVEEASGPEWHDGWLMVDC
jgi:hypothetical protein